MQINVIGRRVRVTSAIEAYARDRADRLPHYMDKVQKVDIVLDREGSEYECEYHVSAIGHSDFIANARHHEVNACIDLAHDKAVRQLHDWKSRLKDDHH